MLGKREVQLLGLKPLDNEVEKCYANLDPIPDQTEGYRERQARWVTAFSDWCLFASLIRTICALVPTASVPVVFPWKSQSGLK
jgi:hypothetical protein